MRFGINLYLWADDVHDGLMPVLERLKKIGYDGAEMPIFDLDQAKWAMRARRLNLAAATKIWRKLFESEDELAAGAYAFLAENWQAAAAAGAAS